MGAQELTLGQAGISALVRIAYVVLHGLARTLGFREEVLIELKQTIAKMVR